MNADLSDAVLFVAGVIVLTGLVFVVAVLLVALLEGQDR